MGLRDAIFGKRDAVQPPSALWGFPSDGGLTFGSSTPGSVLGLSAVWRSVDILTNAVSQLDWRERRGNLDLPPSRIVRRPQAQRTRREWTQLVVSTLALYDVCYLVKVGMDSEGVPMALWYLDPTIVAPSTSTLFGIDYLLPPKTYMVAGKEVDREQMVILHRGPHPTVSDTTGGVLTIARTMFGAALAADRYASRYWQAGGSPTTVLETDQRLTTPQKAELSDAWRSRKMQGPDYAPVIDGGLKARSFGADPTAEAAVEARREQVADIGRYFGIPTAVLNAPAGDSETYRSNDQANADLLRYTVQNYVDAIEDAISDQLPGGRYMEMDTYPLIRASQLLEAQALQLLTGGKAVMTVEEARDVLALPPVEDPSDLLPGQVDAPDLAPEAEPVPMMEMKA